MTASEIISLLKLAPLPEEGGFFRETYRSLNSTAIYYLVTPESYSLFHRISKDEIFHFYLGDPVESFQISQSGEMLVTRLGQAIHQGEVLQVVIPPSCWQGLRLKAGGKWALMGTTVSPPFSYDDFEVGNRAELLRQYPQHAHVIRELTP